MVWPGLWNSGSLFLFLEGKCVIILVAGKKIPLKGGVPPVGCCPDFSEEGKSDSVVTGRVGRSAECCEE